MSTNCDKLQDQYSDYFENTLDQKEVAEFEVHLASCASCRSDYHVFATMFQFLDRIEVTDVEAPAGLRAEMLAEISQRPSAKSFSIRDWLTGVYGRPQVAWGTGMAAAALIVVGLVVSIHPLKTSTAPSTAVSGGLGIQSGPIASNVVPPLVQSVVLKEGTDGANYEVFSLHLPQSLTAAANVSAYVLQDGDPLANAALESDSEQASPAWSGTVEPNVSVSLPVSVTSNVQSGATLNMLLHWSAQDGSNDFREAAFVPITPAPFNQTSIPADSSFYDAISQIAGDYHQTIVVDSSALNAFPKSAPFAGSDGNELNAEQALDDVLASDGFTVALQPGGYYLVSHP